MENDTTGEEWETRGMRWRRFGTAWRQQHQTDLHLPVPARAPGVRSASMVAALEGVRRRARKLRGDVTPAEFSVSRGTTRNTSREAAADARIEQRANVNVNGEAVAQPETLSPRLQQHLERFLRLRLPRIEIHTTHAADRLARRTGADAVTARNAIYFRQGAFEPQSRKGMALLAHEATHIAWDQGARPVGAMSPRFEPTEEHVTLANERRYLAQKQGLAFAQPARPSVPTPSSIATPLTQPFVQAAMIERDLSSPDSEPAPEGTQLSPAALRALRDDVFDALLDKLRSEFERGA